MTPETNAFGYGLNPMAEDPPVLSSETKRLIVFLTPGYEVRAGGVLSIVATYHATRAMKDLHSAAVVLCVVPGDPKLRKYTWFKNNDPLYDLAAVLDSCRNLEYLLLHVPEYCASTVAYWLQTIPIDRIPKVHINVMVQNIDLMMAETIGSLRHFGTVTCTTAHDSYTTPEMREAWGVPLHKLSVCIGHELYALTGYEQKKPTLVVSTDEHPYKERVLRRITEAYPELQVVVVQDMAYEDYRDLINTAKWSLTFGEGLDSYFTEETWSGGVAFAVYNERYFTPAFANLENVYPSWDVVLRRIAADMQRLDEPAAYERCWRQGYDLLNEMYSVSGFTENLRRFYRGEYTLL